MVPKKELSLSKQEADTHRKKMEQVVDAPDILKEKELALFERWRNAWSGKSITYEQFYESWKEYFIDREEFDDYVGIPNPEIQYYIHSVPLIDSFDEEIVAFKEVLGEQPDDKMTEEELAELKTRQATFDFNKIFFVERGKWTGEPLEMRIRTDILPLPETDLYKVKKGWVDLTFALLNKLRNIQGGDELLVGRILLALEEWETVNLRSVRRDASFYPTFPEDEEKKSVPSAPKGRLVSILEKIKSNLRLK